MASFWETIQVDGEDMHVYASVPSGRGGGPFPAVIADALPCDLPVVEFGVHQFPWWIFGTRHGPIFAAIAATGVTETVRFAVVEQDAVSERLGVVCTRRQIRTHRQRPAVEVHHASGAQPAYVHTAGVAVDVVDVQLVELQRSVFALRVVPPSHEPEALQVDVHSQLKVFSSRSNPRIESNPVDAM